MTTYFLKTMIWVVVLGCGVRVFAQVAADRRPAILNAPPQPTLSGRQVPQAPSATPEIEPVRPNRVRTPNATNWQLRPGDPPSALSGNTRLRQQAEVVIRQVVEPIPEDELERREKWRSLQQQIKKADDEVERKKLGAELKDLLGLIFDEDLGKRDTDLKELEARVEKLRAAIENRRANRDRIINVQVEAVLLDAEGLTFPGSLNPSYQVSQPAFQNQLPPSAGRNQTPWRSSN